MNKSLSTILNEDVTFFNNAKRAAFTRKKFFSKIEEPITKFWNSPLYFVLLFILGLFLYSFVPSVSAVALMGIILSIFMLFCEDILATTLPFMMMMVMGVRCYKDLTVYKVDLWVAVIMAICLIVHLIIYAKPVKIGRSFIGLVLVTIATACGGIGSISCEEYCNPVSLYYAYGLGFGMLLTYVIVKTHAISTKGHSPLKKLGRILYVTGLFMGYAILFYYFSHDTVFADGFAIPFLSWRNYASTVLLVCMTVPCYYAIRSDLHILSIFFMYFAMIMTGSRSGLFFGAVLLVGCIAYLFKYNKKKRRVYFMVLLIGAIPFVILCFVLVQALFSDRIVDGTLIYWQDSRISFFERALEDFFSNPFFGQGLGYQGNADVFMGVPGSMVFYHNYVAQIIGSMGLLGIFAYIVLVYDRLSILTKRFSARTATFVMGYVGVLLMSMTNPGEFTPIPCELIVVIIFALVESEPIVERHPDTGRRVIPEKEEDYINGIK